MRPLSVRTRVVLGSLVGGLGLVALSSIVAAALATRSPITLRLSHSAMMAISAVVCVIIALTQVRRGLAPFAELRARLQAVREGREPRVDGAYPTELQPVVDDLNALLADRERMIDRARAKAGDLAHGLKTPLAVLAQEADRADAAGQHELAVTVGQQVDRMRRQVDYHLAHARAAASGARLTGRANVRACADALARTLTRLHVDRGLSIDVDVDAAIVVRCDTQDLEEMLGNLLDNACMWAARRVRVTTETAGAGVSIVVDDDGPGLAAAMREKVLQRGVRADEADGAGPGSGLGLAIVRDIVELHGGSIALDVSPQGGLRARLTLARPS